MPANVVPAAGWPTIQVPTNGESADATALLSTTVQPIANRLERIRTRVIGSGTGYGISVPGGAPLYSDNAIVPTFASSPGTGSRYLVDLSLTLSATALWDWTLPFGALVTEVHASVVGVGGTVLPVAKPYMVIETLSIGGGYTTHATVTDASATLGAYQVAHSLSLTGLSVSVGSGDVVRVGIAKPANASEPNLRVQSLYLVVE